ncbi:MAG: Holliday junction resolvase-like protein [Acidobacteriota bacterium]|jgi:predicted Holliday junction resolvase-like endonuclease
MDQLLFILLLLFLIAVGVIVYLNTKLVEARAVLPGLVQSAIEDWRPRLEEDIVRRERTRFREWHERELEVVLARAQREALLQAHDRFQQWCEQELLVSRREQQDLAVREARRLLAEWKTEQEKQIRQDAIQRSQAVTVGKVTEHLVPHLPNFNFNPKDARFIGSPIDFIIFDGLNDDEENQIREVVFLEIKTGTSTLTRRERMVRDAIKAGRVRWLEWSGNNMLPTANPGHFE